MKQGLLGFGLLAALAAAGPALAQVYTGPLIDAHVHYSHDAWDMLPPDKAGAILRSEARLARVPVSSRSEEHTSELQSPMRISYAVFGLKKKNSTRKRHDTR